MRLVTWNINSARLRLPLIQRLIGELNPDIICLQEIKGETAVFPGAPLRELGFEHQHVRGMKGYNGVAILSRHAFKPLPLANWCNKDDARHIAVELKNGVELHNFYVPAGGDIPDPAVNDKFAHKLAFMDEMAKWSKKGKTQSRILVGDLNIAPLPDDVWSHKQLLDVVSHTPIEVEKMERLMETADWVDSARALTPAPAKLYSWWSYRAADWAKSDKGRRLDHVWLTPDVAKKLKGNETFKAARGWQQASDHAPVVADLDIKL